MSKTAIVTGSAGFVGQFLVTELRDRGYAVVGVDRLSIRDTDARQLPADITDVDQMTTIFRSVHPNAVFHLAALASPRKCEAEPVLATRMNIEGTLSVLSSAATVPSCKVLIVGTSHEYSVGDAETVILREDMPLGGSSIYGLTKEAAERMAFLVSDQLGIDTYFARSFNHTGPGQIRDYAVGSFVGQSVDFARGRATSISVGNLDAERDFLDVRDVCAAYVDIIENGRPQRPYNVCSGRAVAMSYLLSAAMRSAGAQNAPVHSQQASSDSPRVVAGDNTRIREECDWNPRYSIDRTIEDMVMYQFDKSID